MIQFSKVDIPRFDQNRIYLGVEYPWSKQIATELGYIKIHQSKLSGGYFDRDVIRFTFYHRIDHSREKGKV